MADLSVSTNQQIITELTGRESFKGLVLTVVPGASSVRDLITAVRSNAIGRRQALDYLHQAADQIESGGGS